MGAIYAAAFAAFVASLVILWATMIGRINARAKEEEHRVSMNPNVLPKGRGAMELEVPDTYPDLPLPPNAHVKKRVRSDQVPGTKPHDTKAYH